MSKEKLSKISERNSNIMTIHGIDTFFPPPAPIGKFDFFMKQHPELHKCPFFIVSRCHNRAELSVPTARALAKYILKQCNKVDALKGGEK